MTQAEKLEALVRKAASFGFEVNRNQVELALENVRNGAEIFRNDYFAILFSHAFARALFGDLEEEYFIGSSKYLHQAKVRLPAYEARLQQAVISIDPIDCMYEAVFNG